MRIEGKMNQVGKALLMCALLHSAVWAIQPFEPTQPDPTLESWRWQSFPELKGLGLRVMAQDSDGAMWFGLNAGVRRYDGLRWQEFTPDDGLIGAPVNVLCAAKDGSLYAGTEKGISRFSQDRWERVFPPEGDLPWPIDEIIQTSDGKIWAATAWGVLQLDGDRFTLLTSRDMAETIAEQAPYIRVSIVPEAVLPARIWPEGTGIKVTKGGYLGITRGSVPLVVWKLAADGPGESAGLKLGDRIMTLNGQLPQLPHLELDGPGGPVKMVIIREGREDPFELVVPRGKMEGHSSGFSVSDICEDRNGSIWMGLSWGGRF